MARTSFLLPRAVMLGMVMLTAGSLPAANAQKMPKLVKGVLKTVPATPQEAEVYTGPRPLHALADQTKAWRPHYEAENRTLAALTRQMTFRRDVWQLEFSFKTMRLIRVPDGRGGEQLVWYLIYKVDNVGGQLQMVESKDEFGNPKYEIKPGSGNLRFLPVMVLHDHENDKKYADRILPGVREMIHAREIKDPKIALHDSVSITRVPLKPSTENTDNSVWGVAMWPAVDGETDFFSVYIQGLSNAYKWDDAKDKQPLLTFKTLQLNFWRPSDAIFQQTKEFRFGLPLYPDAEKTSKVREMYGVEDPADWNWIYQ